MVKSQKTLTLEPESQENTEKKPSRKKITIKKDIIEKKIDEMPMVEDIDETDGDNQNGVANEINKYNIDKINALLCEQNQFLSEKRQRQLDQLNKDKNLIIEYEQFLTNYNFTDNEDIASVSNISDESFIDNKADDFSILGKNGSQADTISQILHESNVRNMLSNRDGGRNDFVKKRAEPIEKIDEQIPELDDVTVNAREEIKKDEVEVNLINIEEEKVLEIENTIRDDNMKMYSPIESIELNFLKSKTTPELIEYGKEKVSDISSMYRQEMISAILKQFSESNPENTIIGEGVLEVLPDGFGFLRYSDCNYVSSPYDIYVSFAQVKKFALRTGDSLKGTIKAPKRGEKYFSLLRLDAINNQTIEQSKHRIRFDDLIPLYPQEKLMLENENLFAKKKDDTCRILDIISPIGKGQRALIVAPPKTGKTTILQNIAHSVTNAHPDAVLIVLLIDERPEEVTDMARTIKGEVVSSTFDEPATRHVQLAEVVIEKAKRIVETGKDVIILLDSITRLARAYNNVLPSSGKVLTGGVDANALQKPKRFFGAARNIENGGSLTIIATALVETGSKMDEVIFEEFKGTGNSEILLDRKISEKRIFPSIDVIKSSTRREELLLDKATLAKTWMLRKILSSMDTVGAIEFFKEKLNVTKNNAEFFKSMNG
jgi:transcription termination factor Rho